MKLYIPILLLGITPMEATSVSNSNAKEDETLSSYVPKVDVRSSTNDVIADNNSDEDSLLSLLHGGMKEHRSRVSVYSFSLVSGFSSQIVLFLFLFVSNYHMYMYSLSFAFDAILSQHAWI